MKVVAHLCIAVTLLAGAQAAEWDSYQVILDRHPFGSLRDTTNATPEYAKSLRLSALWQSNGKACAGFEDASTKTNQSFVLTCGEKSEDGLELLEVRYADEAAVVRKGAEITVMHMQAGVSTNLPPPTGPMMMPGVSGTPTTNPWRDFYERYRQRRRDERGSDGAQGVAPGDATMQPMSMPPMPQGGTMSAPPMPTAISPETIRQLMRDGVIPESHKKHKSH